MFSKGYYSEGPEICDTVMNQLRYEIEMCDNVHGFQIVHAIGGGTGSGLGSLIMEKINDEYSSKIISNYSILPSF